MWRSDNQREYLLRSLFHDVSLLSPVREEGESFESPPRRPRTRTALLPPSRPCSPLPPLIIEVEKRVNKHDHPEEFYVRLEKKIKRIYRRLFIEGRNISSPMSTDDDDDDGYSNDDKRSQERSNGNIDIDEGADNSSYIEPIVISDRSLKRRTNNDSSESDEEEIKAKKSNRNHSSRADDEPRSSSKEEFEDETTARSIIEISSETEENIEEEEEHCADVEIDSFVEEDSIDESCVERDSAKYTSESLDYIQVTFKADVHRAYSDEANEANADLLPPANGADEMADENNDASGDDSASESVKDPEAAYEEIEESLENNEVSENQSSSASGRGVDMTTPCIQPDSVHDAEQPEQADEGTGEPLEKDEVPGNNAMPAPDRGDDTTTLCIQPDDIIHDAEPAAEETIASLENSRVPYKNLLAPAPDREVDLMRSPLIRPSVGSLPEHMDSNDEQQIDLEFLNRTQDVIVDDAIEDRDAIEERDAETQTSFEETSPEGWGNIFYGQPRVFKLCRCRYHVCD